MTMPGGGLGSPVFVNGDDHVPPVHPARGRTTPVAWDGTDLEEIRDADLLCRPQISFWDGWWKGTLMRWPSWPRQAPPSTAARPNGV
jgi:hypothetical protein